MDLHDAAPSATSREMVGNCLMDVQTDMTPSARQCLRQGAERIRPCLNHIHEEH